MREYKFRGFRFCKNGKEKVYINGEWLTGEWVYGYLLQSDLIIPVQFFGYTEDKINNRNIVSLEQMEFYKVIPETVGQYTGLNDKNGKEIYEGDIVKYDFFKEERIGKIIYKGCCYEIENEGCSLCVSYFDNQVEIEVIGNVPPQSRIVGIVCKL